MKPYGIPRYINIECPDLEDIRYYGLKSFHSRDETKSGDRKNSFRRPSVKAAARRKWKKKERRAAKLCCLESEYDY